LWAFGNAKHQPFHLFTWKKNPLLHALWSVEEEPLQVEIDDLSQMSAPEFLDFDKGLIFANVHNCMVKGLKVRFA
jgi:hypothetical protein